MIFSETSKVALRFYQFFNTMVMGRKRKGSLFDMKSKPYTSLVGVTGLEPATSRPPDAYSNQLSYTPILWRKQEALLHSCRLRLQNYDENSESPNLTTHFYDISSPKAYTRC